MTISVKDLLKLPHDEGVIVLNGAVEEILAPIKKMALSPRRLRLIWVRLWHFLFGVVQGVLIWCLLVAVPMIDTFNLMWLCPGLGSVVFSLWLGLTFTILGWLRARFERDVFGEDEVIYMRMAQENGNNWQRLLEPHPMILILRPSNYGQANRLNTPHYIDYLIGMSQLLWICVLSFLFSSTIGGTLFWTLIMIVTFITIVHVSRGLSILACIVAQKHLNLRVIEYDNLREKRMMQILLVGLTGLIMDIRWVNWKKTQHEESIKMYQWGYQLSHGDLMENQCTLHAKVQRQDVKMGHYVRSAAVGLFFIAGFNLSVIDWMYYMADPNGYLHSGLNRSGQSLGIISLLFPGVLACWNLGQTKKFLICDCN